MCLSPVWTKAKIRGNIYGATRSAGDYWRKVQLARGAPLTYLSVGGFYSEVALRNEKQKAQ